MAHKKPAMDDTNYIHSLSNLNPGILYDEAFENELFDFILHNHHSRDTVYT